MAPRTKWPAALDSTMHCLVESLLTGGIISQITSQINVAASGNFDPAILATALTGVLVGLKSYQGTRDKRELEKSIRTQTTVLWDEADRMSAKGRLTAGEMAVLGFDNEEDHRRLQQLVDLLRERQLQDEARLEAFVDELRGVGDVANGLAEVVGQYSARIDEIAALQAVHGQAIELIYSHCRRLRRLVRGRLSKVQEDIAGLNAGLREQARRLDETCGLLARQLNQPVLTIPFYDTPAEETSAAYVFRARRAQLVGRADEEAALHEFVGPIGDGPERGRFSWWLMSGPGGVGKSRLALELCLWAEERGWNAGFIVDGKEAFGSGHLWRPPGPTLMVVDYASQWSGQLGEKSLLGSFISKLAIADARRELTQPLRILLLEREAGGQWLTDMLSAGDRHCIESSAYDVHWPPRPEPTAQAAGVAGMELSAVGSGEVYSRQAMSGEDAPRAALRLDGLKADALWSIVVDLHEKAGKAADCALRNQTVALLEQADVGGRPLFAAFAANAMMSGVNVNNWRFEDLVSYAVDREERLWNECGIDDRHRNLLLLVTMTSGKIAAADLRTMVADPQLQRLLPPVDNLNREWYRRLSGHAVDGRLRPLEPDILGECFVLRRMIHQLPHDEFADHRGAILKVTWQYAPAGMGEFLIRLARDFGKERTREVGYLLSRPQIAAADNKNLMIRLTEGLGKQELDYLLSQPQLPATDRLWAVLVVQLIPIMSEQGGLSLAEGLYNELQRFAKQHHESGEIAMRQAQAARNLTVYYYRKKDIDQVEKLYREMRDLAEQHVWSGKLALLQAKTAYNLITDYGKHNLSRVEQLYEELKALAKLHDEEGEIALLQAKGAFNLTLYHGKENFDRVEQLYKDLKDLTKRHAEDSEIAFAQAMTAVNLTVYYGKKNLPRAEAMYTDISTLAKQHDNNKIALIQARAAFNLTIDYDKDNLPRVEELYGDLKALAERHIWSSEFALRQAQVAFGLALYYDKDNMPRVEELYGHLKALAEQHGGSNQAALVQVNANFKCRLLRGNENRLHMKEFLQAAAESHFEVGEIALLQARAAFHLATCHGQGNLPRVKQLHEELRVLAARHRGLGKIALERARTACVIVNFMGLLRLKKKVIRKSLAEAEGAVAAVPGDERWNEKVGEMKSWLKQVRAALEAADE